MTVVIIDDVKKTIIDTFVMMMTIEVLY